LTFGDIKDDRFYAMESLLGREQQIEKRKGEGDCCPLELYYYLWRINT
jgi:hypothetical protein